jgi:hypothetical protein
MPTNFSPAGNRDVVDVGVHKIILSNVTVSDILDSDHFPVVFHILHHVKTTKFSHIIENVQIWKVSKPGLEFNFTQN